LEGFTEYAAGAITGTTGFRKGKVIDMKGRKKE
jgi:hypothetical protein